MELFWEKMYYLILSPLPHSKYLYRKQLKNNQNQMNTTGAQNLKDFGNKPPSPSSSPTDLKIKKTNAVIC
jgi:hypothetical protein